MLRKRKKIKSGTTYIRKYRSGPFDLYRFTYYIYSC